MGSKAATIMDNIKTCAGADIHDRMLSLCGELGEKPTPRAQAKYVVSIMENLPQYCDSGKTAEIMGLCGASCISGAILAKAKKLYATSGDFSEFLEKLNQEHIGGGKLHVDGGKVIGVYDTCYCGLAKTAKNLSPAYCDCSAGWFKTLFSTVLGADVSVIRRNTILGGADECVFEIDIGKLPNL